MSKQSSDKPFVPLSLEEQMALVEETIDFERIDKFYFQYNLLINSTVRKMFKRKHVNYDANKVNDYVVHAFVFFAKNDFEYLKKWRDKWKKQLSDPDPDMKLKKLPGFLIMLACYSTLNQLSDEFDFHSPPPLNIEDVSIEVIDDVIEISKNCNKQIEIYETIEAIYKCLPDLTPLQRLIFKLHYLYYIELEKIATMMHRDRNAIDQCLMTGRNKVRDCTKKLFSPKNGFFLKKFHKKMHQ
jgi:DNA-directed RNA polymerase specialized sigma24 family protein